MAAATNKITVKYGCPVSRPEKPKKNLWIIPVVDLLDILGGDDITLGIVSRIDVRDGVIGEPEMVTSQYLRFCHATDQYRLTYLRSDANLHLRR